MTGPEFHALTAEQIIDLIAVKTARKDAVTPDYYVSDLAAREFHMLAYEIREFQKRLEELQ